MMVASLALAFACGGEAGDGCERSAYELQRARHRCTPDGELQTLECGEWETVAICGDSCSPGPDPGCD